MIVLAQNRKVGNDINRITVEFKSGTLFVKSGSAFILIESQWNLNENVSLNAFLFRNSY